MTQNDVNKIINIIKANFVQKKDNQNSLITENQATVISSIIEKYIADEEIAPETHSPADALTQQQVDALVALITPSSSLNTGSNDPFGDGSLIHLYKMNTTIRDEINGAHMSVASGSEAYEAGKFNEARKYDNSHDVFSPQAGIKALSFWVKASDGITSTPFGILSTSRYTVFDDGTGVGNYTNFDTTYFNDTWNHIVVNVDSNKEVYLNGAPVSIAGTSSNSGDARSWCFGADVYGATVGTKLVGDIDQVMLFNRNLTQDEVTALYEVENEPDSSLNAGNANTELLANPTFSIDSGNEFDLWIRNTFLDGAVVDPPESVVGQSENTIGIYASSAVDNSTDEHIYTNHIIQTLTTNIPAGTHECAVRIDAGTLNVGYNNVVTSVEVKAIYADDTTDSVVLIENTETATELAVAGDIVKDMSFAQEVKRIEFLVKVWNHANGSISGGAIVTQDSFVTISAVSIKVKD
jgi:hypothetical protein